ncbi:MAG: sigma-70 family RNA polymerase sigma factor [Mycoplasmataceae bacterium]|jgi:RNA polymerase sigma factor (sigma-70 family)|nr:sigma-70 family RNA polymerase sigma factor [Mycoplasmataceae bacterium]
MNVNQLIEQYQNNKNILIRDQLYEQNKELLEKLTSNLVRNLFPNICLEHQDFMSYSYLSFIKCLDTFNTKQRRYTFTQALLVTNKSMVIRYASRVLQRGHRALNAAYSLEEQSEYSLKNYVNDNDPSKKVEQEIELEKINEYLSHLDLMHRRVVRLKVKGYTTEEISQILHIKSKAVANMYNLICKKYRKCRV